MAGPGADRAGTGTGTALGHRGGRPGSLRRVHRGEQRAEQRPLAAAAAGRDGRAGDGPGRAGVSARAGPAALTTDVLEVPTTQGTARLLVDHADRPAAVLVLGHGAGGGPQAPDLALLGPRLAG